MICKHKSTKLNSSKYCYVSLTSVIRLHTVLFQTIQFSINHLFVHNSNVKQFYLTNR